MYKMSINTQRLHLNTNDAENVEGNHANSIFNLAKANINCLSGQELSISLIKAVLPITMDAFGYMEDKVAFTMYIIDSTFPPKLLKCFITADDLDIPPYATITPDEFRFPITYLDSPLSIQDTLNKILASQYSGSPAVQFIIRKDSKRTSVQFDSATATELRFDNDYVVNGRSNYNLPAQRLFTALGINTFNSPELSSIVPAETIFKGGNGGIDSGTNVFYEYQLSVYHPPLNLVSNLSLDSASSNKGGARNNILAGIQIDIQDQSREMEFISTTGSSITVSKSSSLINHINHSVNDSHKIISATSVSTLNLILESSDGLVKFSDSNIYYEIEIKTYNSQ
tara:strand:- start:459 stop:1478 length:1020 start_codon:yes stop_codon:yes gene_type:complete